MVKTKNLPEVTIPRERSRGQKLVRHINLPLESLYLLKKPHQNPLRSFKDLSVHRDIQHDRKSDFVLYYVVISRKIKGKQPLSLFLGGKIIQ